MILCWLFLQAPPLLASSEIPVQATATGTGFIVHADVLNARLESLKLLAEHLPDQVSFRVMVLDRDFSVIYGARFLRVCRLLFPA